MRKTSREAGFTMIEIMIVVMVIGVLAAIVLPTFRLTTARAKVSEAILALGTCRNAVSEAYLNGTLPLAGEFGCENAVGPVSTYVGTIDTKADGTIVVELNGFLDPRLDLWDITLAPLDSTGVTPAPGDAVARWRCGLPADGTNLDPKYLPNSCRGN